MRTYAPSLKTKGETVHKTFFRLLLNLEAEAHSMLRYLGVALLYPVCHEAPSAASWSRHVHASCHPRCLGRIWLVRRMFSCAERLKEAA